MKRFAFLFLLYSLQPFLFSQNSKQIDSLKKFGRENLIELAVKKITEPGFNKNNYDRIIVKASPNSLIVEFCVSVILSGNKSCFYDEIYVALAGSGSGKSIKGDCENPVFYNLSVSDKKKIEFVFDAINKSTEIGHIPNNKLGDGSTMEISEKPSYYHVEMSDWSTFSHYNINKTTGEISDANHKHYDRSNEEKDEFEIIK